MLMYLAPTLVYVQLYVCMYAYTCAYIIICMFACVSSTYTRIIQVSIYLQINILFQLYC